MRRRIKKLTHKHGGNIKKTPVQAASIIFSFKYFDHLDDEICPARFVEDYTRALMMRLRVLCDWSVAEFQSKYQKNMRNHLIDWEKTSRSQGFSRIPAEHKATPAYQFAVAEHKHGRVHGFFIGDTFHIVWLDSEHSLYPDDPL